jgi:hypothetical protein
MGAFYQNAWGGNRYRAWRHTNARLPHNKCQYVRSCVHALFFFGAVANTTGQRTTGRHCLLHGCVFFNAKTEPLGTHWMVNRKSTRVALTSVVWCSSTGGTGQIYVSYTEHYTHNHCSTQKIKFCNYDINFYRFLFLLKTKQPVLHFNTCYFLISICEQIGQKMWVP